MASLEVPALSATLLCSLVCFSCKQLGSVLVGSASGPGLLPEAQVLELVSRSVALPPDFEDPRRIAALRAFVERGGGLFLRGRAVQLLAALGLATKAPGAEGEARVESHGLWPDGDANAYDDDRAIGLGFTQDGARQLGGPTNPLWLCRGGIWRAEVDAMRPVPVDGSTSQRAFVFAEEFRFEGQRIVRRDAALLLGFEVGQGRVLALGFASDEPLPEDFEASCRAWLARGAEAPSSAVLLDQGPRPRIDGWGPGAMDEVKKPGGCYLRLAAAAVDDEAVLDKLSGQPVDVVVLEDDGASLARFRERRQRLAAKGLGFGIAAPSLRSELEPLLAWQGEEAPVLDLFVEAYDPSAIARPLDADFIERLRRNASTRLLTLRPIAPADAASSAYLSRDAGIARGVAEPCAKASELASLPPAFYRTLEVDTRHARGGLGDAIYERFVAFARGRAGASILLAVSPQELDRALDIARTLRDPFGHATVLVDASSGPTAFEAAVAAGEAEPGEDTSQAPAPFTTKSLRNRWFRVAGNGIDVDPQGLQRFEPSRGQRVTARWCDETIHGMRIGDPALFERILAPTRLSLEAFDIHVGREAHHDLALGIGRFELRFEASAGGLGSVIEVEDGQGRHAYFAVPRGGLRACSLAFDVVNAKSERLSFRVRPHPRLPGGSARIEKLSIESRGIEAEVETSRPNADLQAALVREVELGHYAATRSFVTRGDLPAVIERLRFRAAVKGLRLERSMHFPAHRLRPRGVDFDLEPRDGGAARLRLLVLERGRMSVEARGDALHWSGHPRAHEEWVVALVLVDAIPEHVVPEVLRTPLLGLARRDSQPASPAPDAGGSLVSQRPRVEGMRGAHVTERSRASLVLDHDGRGFGASTPRLDFGAELVACTVDGEAWRLVRGTSLVLPPQGGVLNVAWTSERLKGPRILGTRALLRSMRYDDKERLLTFVVDEPPLHFADERTTYRLRILGNTPRSVRGAALVGVGLEGVFELEAPRGSVSVYF